MKINYKVFTRRELIDMLKLLEEAVFNQKALLETQARRIKLKDKMIKEYGQHITRLENIILK